MENKEAKKASESEVLGDTINDSNVVEEPVVANSTDLQDGRGNSRSPGKDRGGDSFARLVPDSARGAESPQAELGGSLNGVQAPAHTGDRSPEAQNIERGKTDKTDL